MKVALVHDYLNQYGGAERVLETLMEIFPEAPVYTLMHDVEKTGGRFAGRVAKTSFLDFPLARQNHRLFIPAMPLAAKTITIDHNYDLVISDSAGFAKGINITCHSHSNCHGPRHISYIHTPLRYAWEQEEYLGGILSNWQLVISKPILNYLKWWDHRAGQRPDILIANSEYIAGKIKDYYGREAKVVYPPVDTEKFFYENNPLHPPYHKGEKRGLGRYYLAIGRLLHYKRFDLIIEAFARLGLPLKIVGSGPEEERLKRQASSVRNIEVLQFIKNEDELRKLYNGARALIFPQVEDFGLVAAEAQACGTPVIAYAAGGALEIVQDGKTGILFKEQTVESLAGAVARFEKKQFSRPAIAKSVQRFSKEEFKNRILDSLAKLS